MLKKMSEDAARHPSARPPNAQALAALLLRVPVANRALLPALHHSPAASAPPRPVQPALINDSAAAHASL